MTDEPYTAESRPSIPYMPENLHRPIITSPLLVIPVTWRCIDCGATGSEGPRG